jgi:hypothetical protein
MPGPERPRQLDLPVFLTFMDLGILSDRSKAALRRCNKKIKKKKSTEALRQFNSGIFFSYCQFN